MATALSLMADHHAELFEQARPRLWGLAYRMLGSAADAEDAVQDTYLSWRKTDWRTIDTPLAWLTTACTRRCIDLLRAANRQRVDYVGPWLPEPVFGEQTQQAEDMVELAASLSTAFLLLLERLTPAERAAYLLHDIFDYDYRDVASALDKSQTACRKLVSRARGRVGGTAPRFALPQERREQLLDGFLQAVRTGAVQDLEQLLAEDAELWGDGGGKVIAAPQVIRGTREISLFLTQVLYEAWRSYEISRTTINGDTGLMLQQAGEMVGTVSLAADSSGRICGIYIVRNPDKLGHLHPMVTT